MTRKLATTEALGTVSKERDALANELAQACSAQQADAQLAETKLAQSLQAEAAKKTPRFRPCKPTRRLAMWGAETGGEPGRERDALKSEFISSLSETSCKRTPTMAAKFAELKVLD